MTDGLSGWPQSRADVADVVYEEPDGTRYRLRFEPGDEGDRWALVESRWDYSTGEWRHVGTKPVRDLFVDAPAEVLDS